MSRGRGVHIVTEKYVHKKGLYCSECNREISRRTLNSSGIKHSYNAFTDSCTFEVVCSKCMDAPTVIPLAVMFPANLQQQISRLTHYLAQDSVNLLAFFRCLEGICYALGLERDMNIPDPAYEQYMADKTTRDTKRLFYDDDDNDNESVDTYIKMSGR